MSSRAPKTSSAVDYRRSRFEGELRSFLQATQGDGAVDYLSREGVAQISVDWERFPEALERAGIRSAVRFYGTLFMNTVLNMASHAYDRPNHDRSVGAIRPTTWLTTPTSETPGTPYTIFECVKDWTPAKLRSLHETCRDLSYSWAVEYGRAFRPRSAIAVLRGLIGDRGAHGDNPDSPPGYRAVLRTAFEDALEMYERHVRAGPQPFRWPPDA